MKKPTINVQVEKTADLVLRARVLLDAWHLSAGEEGRARFHDFWDEYWEFWRFNEYALLFSHVVHTAALFETRNDTINFQKLWNEIQKTGVDHEDACIVQGFLSKASDAAKDVIILRSNALAHRSDNLSYDDAFVRAQLTPDKLRALSDLSLSLANSMLKIIGSTEREFAKLPAQTLIKLASHVI
jgi:AbiU2